MSQLQNKKISFIGGGNMAQALISGLLGKGMNPAQITVADPNASIRQQLQNKGLNTIDPSEDATRAVKDADVVVLAVKPQVMRSVVSGFCDALEQQLLISVAAGIDCQTLTQMLGGYGNIVRAMPNTPAMIQMGAIGLFATDDISEEHKQLAYAVMAASGLALWVDDEDLLHAVTAVAGSAPAYFFYFIESIIAEGINQGLDSKQASALAMQTALGAAQMCIASDDTPAELRRKVCSPNGTTQQAVDSMQANQVGEMIAQAMQACSARSREMSVEFINQ